MSKTVDARGLACPQPVILTGKALKDVDIVTVIVDNETAMQNVSRMASKKGCKVQIDEKDGDFHIHLQKENADSEEETPDVSPAPSGDIVLVIASDKIGQGSDELGEILMRAFMHTFMEVEPMPQTMIFMNSGVKLVVEGSLVLEDLQTLAEEGIEILACGTCLDYFKVKDKVAVGEISNTYTIAETILQAGKVVRL